MTYPLCSILLFSIWQAPPAQLILIIPNTLQHYGGLLPDHFKIIGFDPTQMSHDEYIDLIKSSIDVDTHKLGEELEKFYQRCTYICNNGDKDKPFVALREYMEELGGDSHSQDRIFYMALPPKAYISVSEQLKRNCYSPNGTSRIIVSFFFLYRQQKMLNLSYK